MLSKKMAFSLMSLITIIALVFTVTPAMANRVKLSIVDADPDGQAAATGDIGTFHKERGDNQADISFKTGIQVIAGETIVIRLTANEVMDASSIAPADFILVGSATSATANVADGVQIEASGIPIINGKTIDITLSGTAGDNGEGLEIYLQPNSIVSAVTGRNDNTAASLTFEYVNDDGTAPVALDVVRSDGAIHPIFEEMVTFTIKLSEEPKEGKFTAKDHLDIKEATVSSLHALGTMDDVDVDGDPDGDTNDHAVGMATGGDDNIYLYALVLKPKYANKNKISIKVKKFKDQFDNESAEKTVEFQVAASAVRVESSAGTVVSIPNDLIIPAGGYLIVAKDDDDGIDSEQKTSESLIEWPGDPKEATADIALRKPAFRTYNVIESADLFNLETFLINGGTIDLKSAHAVKITEIMWGTDGGDQNRQWIEIMNTTAAALKTKDYKLVFYSATELVPVTTTAVAATATTPAIPVGSVPAGVADRVGTIYKGGHWSLTGKGQSGRIEGIIERSAETGQAAGATQGGIDLDIEVVPTNPLISMQRAKMADGMYGDGTMASSWVQSTPPSDNFKPEAKGLLIGTPGFSPIISEASRMAAAAEEKAKSDAAAKATADAAAKAAATGTVPQAGNIYISEVMFAGGGSLPQWIEIANSSRAEEINLSGWTLTVDNAAGDTDVSVGGSIKFTIPAGTMIGMYGQNAKPSTILVVTEMGRYDLGKGAGQVLNLWQDGQTELILAGVNKRRYSLLSSDAFLITLAPPAPAATTPAATETPAAKAQRLAAERVAADARKAATDRVGNLGADGMAAWALPTNMEGGRSSIIRTHISVNIGPAEPNDGMMMDGWVLASDTSFAQPTHVRTQSYYGAANDVGTPGFRAGGALPVELSHFRPARQKETGQVVITWATQSELNNAGFFIKRSQQRDGEFKVINAAMVPGAGTTSEKQFYTYTDTTAQPNVVYYYQIEDVSLDGQRQTLTRGIRLKGHVGAAGKATTLWGELKASHE